MKVLFLTRYPVEGASSRYRVYQYIPFLEQHGIFCEVQSFMSPAMYQLVFSKGNTIAKIVHTGFALMRRLSVLLKAKEYDLIFMQRECLPFGPPVMEKLFRRWKIPTIFDYDDALFIFKPSTHNRLVNFLKRPERIFQIFSLVDCVLTGNNYLRDQAAAYCKTARTFPVAEDTDRYRPIASYANTGSFTIGWLGSPSTEKYLNLVTPALQKICKKYPQVLVKIIGGGNYQADGIPVVHKAWNMESEVDELHTFDVGIMPLPMEEWSKGKSGGKARTYMAVGLPAVCTAIGFNLELIDNFRTGFLVTDQEEWVRVLSSLIDDPALCRKVGRAARQYVVKHQSIPVLAPQLLEILHGVAGV